LYRLSCVDLYFISLAFSFPRLPATKKTIEDANSEPKPGGLPNRTGAEAGGQVCRPKLDWALTWERIQLGKEGKWESRKVGLPNFW
jgi:hypothetical protein